MKTFSDLGDRLLDGLDRLGGRTRRWLDARASRRAPVVNRVTWPVWALGASLIFLMGMFAWDAYYETGGANTWSTAPGADNPYIAAQEAEAAPAAPTTISSVPSSPATSGSALTINVIIKDVSTPDGAEPAYVGPNGVGAQSLLTARLGVPVTINVVNQSGMPHSFTSSVLGVNVYVPPGPGTTVIHFTPKKAGLIFWDCTVPCGNWVMSHNGYMRGFVTVMA